MSSSARVRIDGNLSGQTATRKGVRQGCVLDNWNGGITIGGSKISNLRFADDTTLIAASQEELVALLNVLEQHSAAYGLGINYNKTKVMTVDREHDNHREIKSIGRCKADRARIDAFEMWTWRRMVRVPCTAHRTNVSILDELGNPKRLSSITSTRMLTFFGHIHRSDNIEKLVVKCHAPSGRRRGRSPTRWVDTTKQLLDMTHGLPPGLPQWLNSFLNERSLFVVVEGCSSDVFSINAGVTQGFVLSPTLFLLYINELLEITSNPIYSFADDSTLISCMEPGKPLSSQETINVDIKTIVEWGLVNKVQFNVHKTQATTPIKKSHVG
ncbi:unnamed protein product [Callosobruchus maculatus]|uniref:Reverse transcriptase domain-containing protein n=1 Tax=Callosobruchus maculatus TaxID=64391 RepID=A0A653DLX2_CALMS|nr:unnamed protein product [Callosobruchus maculatus]